MFQFRNLGRRGALLAALAGGMVLGGLGGTITLASASPPPSNVIVTNTSANPVPVTVQGTADVAGTVNVSNLPATQAVSGTVNIGNLPAVQAVSISQGTAVLDEMDAQSVPAATSLFFNPANHSFDATAYGTIRVSMIATCSAPMTLTLSQANSGGLALVTLLDEVQVPCGRPGFSKSYDVPGGVIYFAFANPGASPATVWFEAWGRP
jgi:hypothetical protein